MDPVQIIKDPRPISGIYFEGEDADGFTVGWSDVTRIVPYEENGQMAPVTWFAVYQGDHLVVRIPAHMVTVHYKVEP